MKNDERMNVIGGAIKTQANTQAQEIIQKANKYRKDELDSYKENLLEEMYDKMQKQTNAIRHDMHSEIATVQRNEFSSILLRRDQYTQKIFEEVKDKLKEYTKTDKYKTDIIKNLKENLKYCKDATIFLNINDMYLKDEISKLEKSIVVKNSEKIVIGGYIIDNPSMGLQLDETLLMRLNSQREWFLQNCGFAVN